MKTTLDHLTDIFLKATKKAFPEVLIPENKIEITKSTQPQFGDYQCNCAMKLKTELSKNPREIAQLIVKEIVDDFIIENCEIAGPGFINITLKTTYLESRLQKMLLDPRLAIDKIQGHQKIIIDFSSPNVAKEMHVGHLRSTIIGECLANLFEFFGYEVLRLNHIGDWGTAYGMLIAYLKEHERDVLTHQSRTDLTQLVKWYKESKKKFDNDADFKKRAQQEVVALQSGDPNSLKAWQMICEISREAYDQIYDLLGVKLVERGESFYNPMLSQVIKDLEQKGLIQISQGAKCIFLEGFTGREGGSLPLILQKSDGGYNYATTDLAAILHRTRDEKANRIIYVTDAGQSLHFQMIFKAAEMAHYLIPNQVKVDHVTFGLVLGPDGKKFKTRSGETERLIDLLLNAIFHAKKILLERNVEMNENELNEAAESLGINAIKYADLSSNRIHDYVFSYDRMLRFEGNTASFLLYSYVRVNGIKRKVNKDIQTLSKTHFIKLQEAAEIALAVHLDQFDQTLWQMTADLYPHRLSEYLFTLAERFNIFFRDCRVLGDPAEIPRLLLCETVAKVFHQGFEILGLKILEKM